MSQILDFYNQQGGAALSKMVNEMAPFFASIDAEFSDLRKSYSEVKMQNQKKVQNHFGCIHAIALCNGAELAAGTLTDVSIPEGARWIPMGMTVKYLAKAKTDVRIVADAKEVDFETAGNKIVPVVAYDAEDKPVFEAQITMNVKLA